MTVSGLEADAAAGRVVEEADTFQDGTDHGGTADGVPDQHPGVRRPAARRRVQAGWAPMPEVLVVSRVGQAFAELIRPAAGRIEVRPVNGGFGEGRSPFDLIVLHTTTAMRELVALAGLRAPRPPVLIVTHAIVPGDVLTALRSGARSILVEGQYTRADLLDAVTATAAGHSRLSPGPLSAVVDHVQTRPVMSARSQPPLTQGELDVMELLAAGAPNAVIAERLALAEKTVRNRVSQIYLKLQARNRTEAMVQWLGRPAGDEPARPGRIGNGGE